MTSPISFFVTGTDTGVGKTHISSALLLAIRRRSLKAYGYKPVASGCERRGEEWISDDAEKLRAYSTTPTPDLALMNPIALPEPIAPHLAAAHAGREIELPPLLAAHQALSLGAHAIVVEGAGGWAIPYSDHLMQADLVRALKLPVVLVVAIRQVRAGGLDRESRRPRLPLSGRSGRVGARGARRAAAGRLPVRREHRSRGTEARAGPRCTRSGQTKLNTQGIALASMADSSPGASTV